MTYLLAIDPGLTSGISWGWFNDKCAFQLDQTWEVTGGVEGFIRWWDLEGKNRPIDIIVSESFAVNSGNEFTLKYDDVEPLRVEGAIAALCARLSRPIIWQARNAKAGVTDAQMVAGGWWTATPANHTDARDVNDATKHALEYLRRSEHIPTLKVLTGYE